MKPSSMWEASRADYYRRNKALWDSFPDPIAAPSGERQMPTKFIRGMTRAEIRASLASYTSKQGANPNKRFQVATGLHEGQQGFFVTRTC